MSIKPMLAAHAELDKVKFPVLCSTKLDGVRAIIQDGVVLSRKLKPIPNKYVQECFGHQELNGLDGELIVGSDHEGEVFSRTTSGVMSVEGKPSVWFHVFDYIDTDMSFEERYKKVIQIAEPWARILPVQQHLCKDLKQLLEYEEQFLEQGFEGLMIRSLNSPYKFGRSTVREGWLLKLKRYADSEAEIIGFEERMHNANEAKVNALGKTERSNHKENMIPMGTLGALIVKDIHSDKVFNIGSGFDDILRQEIWDNQDKYMGKLAKYKYFGYGNIELPRHPTFLGFRDERDL